MAVLIAILFLYLAYKAGQAACYNAAFAPVMILCAAIGCGILGAM